MYDMNTKKHKAVSVYSMITDEDFCFQSVNKLPANINIPFTSKLLIEMNKVEGISHYWKLLEAQGWTILVVDQTRGRCYYRDRRITIPIWAVSPSKNNKNLGYKEWYVSHELAHAFAGSNAKHGQDFMEWLMIICPIQYRHYELGYKPRNATQAGISLFDSISDNEL